MATRTTRREERWHVKAGHEFGEVYKTDPFIGTAARRGNIKIIFKISKGAQMSLESDSRLHSAIIDNYGNFLTMRKIPIIHLQTRIKAAKQVHRLLVKYTRPNSQ